MQDWALDTQLHTDTKVDGSLYTCVAMEHHELYVCSWRIIVGLAASLALQICLRCRELSLEFFLTEMNFIDTFE